MAPASCAIKFALFRNECVCNMFIIITWENKKRFSTAVGMYSLVNKSFADFLN